MLVATGEARTRPDISVDRAPSPPLFLLQVTKTCIALLSVLAASSYVEDPDAESACRSFIADVLPQDPPNEWLRTRFSRRTFCVRVPRESLWALLLVVLCLYCLIVSSSLTSRVPGPTGLLALLHINYLKPATCNRCCRHFFMRKTYVHCVRHISVGFSRRHPIHSLSMLILHPTHYVEVHTRKTLNQCVWDTADVHAGLPKFGLFLMSRDISPQTYW